jgi:hypothetical protein
MTSRASCSGYYLGCDEDSVSPSVVNTGISLHLIWNLALPDDSDHLDNRSSRAGLLAGLNGK